MNRPRYLPIYVWHVLTWIVHLVIQWAIYRIGWHMTQLFHAFGNLAMPDLGMLFCLLALPIWFYRESLNIEDKRAEHGRLRAWDMLDTIGDLAGPVGIAIWRVS